MSDYNVLTYAIKEVGDETDVPRCMSRARSVYEHIKEREKETRTQKIETKKAVSMEEVMRGIKQDMQSVERPSLGIVNEENYEKENN